MSDKVIHANFCSYSGRTADDEGNLFQGKVGEPGHESILFTSERFIPFISKAEVLVSDATFLMCPLMVGAMQVFIVAFFAFGKVSTMVTTFCINVLCLFSLNALSDQMSSISRLEFDFPVIVTQVFPFAFAIMSSKTTNAYAAITSNLKERGLCAGKVITDWAERQGWKRSFKRLLIWGCLWHFQRVCIMKLYCLLSNGRTLYTHEQFYLIFTKIYLYFD